MVSVLVVNPTVELLRGEMVTLRATVVSVPQQREYMLLSTETLGLCALFTQFSLPDNSKGEPHFPAKCLFPVLTAFVMGTFKLLVGFVFFLEIRTACLLTCRNDSSI